jgi:hypothetical protein
MLHHCRRRVHAKEQQHCDDMHLTKCGGNKAAEHHKDTAFTTGSQNKSVACSLTVAKVKVK